MSEFILGTHAAQIEAVREDVSQMRVEMAAQAGSIKEIHTFVSEVRGGWKAAAALTLGTGAFLGAIVAFITNLTGLFGAKH